MPSVVTSPTCWQSYKKSSTKQRNLFLFFVGFNGMQVKMRLEIPVSPLSKASPSLQVAFRVLLDILQSEGEAKVKRR